MTWFRKTQNILLIICVAFGVLVTISIVRIAHRSEPIQINYVESEIGLMRIVAPDTLIHGKTSFLILQFPTEAIPDPKCTATVEVTSAKGTLSFSRSDIERQKITLYLNENNKFRIQTELRPSPATNEMNALLQVSYALNCPNSPQITRDGSINILLHTPEKIYDQFADYLSDPGLLTGVPSLLLSIVAFLFTQSLEREKQLDLFRTELDEIEKLITKDSLGAIQRLNDLKIDCEKKGLMIPGKYEDIKRLCESRAFIINLLEEIGQVIDRGDENQISYIFEQVQKINLEPFETYKPIVSVVRMCTGEIKPIKPEEILTLWDEYDVHSASLIIYALSKGLEADHAPLKEIKTSIESKPERKRLIRYKEFEPIKNKCKLTLPAGYYWVYPPMPENHLVTDLQRMFPSASSTRNHVTWAEPLPWEEMKSNSHASYITQNSIDTHIAAVQLWAYYREHEEHSSSGYFPVFWTVDQRTSDQPPFLALAHYLAEHWFEFITNNPSAFLDLHPNERKSLAAYLAWHNNNISAVILRFKHNLTSQVKFCLPDKKFNKEFDFALELLSGMEAPYSKESPPTDEQILDWMKIRPPWLTRHTVIILTCSTAFPAEWGKTLRQVKYAFSRRNIILKTFETIESTMEATPLAWDETSLSEYLKSAITATTHFDTLTSLFADGVYGPHETQAADESLIGKSSRSLSQMLGLTHKLFEHHFESHKNNVGIKFDEQDKKFLEDLQ